MHTESSLPNLLRHDPEDRNNFDHNLNDDVRHSRRWLNLYIRIKPLKEELHAAKQLDNNVLASADVLSGLRHISVRKTSAHRQGRYSLEVRLQFQQKSQPQVGLSVITHVKR